VPGSTVPGSTVPGSTVPGSTVPGSTVPGSTVPGSTVVTVGGLARSDAAGGFETEFAELAGELRRAQDGHGEAADDAVPRPPGDAVLRNDTLVLDDTELDAAAQAADDADDAADPGPAGGPGGSDPADPGPGAAASPDTESAEVHGPRHVPSAGE